VYVQQREDGLRGLQAVEMEGVGQGRDSWEYGIHNIKVTKGSVADPDPEPVIFGWSRNILDRLRLLRQGCGPFILTVTSTIILYDFSTALSLKQYRYRFSESFGIKQYDEERYT